MSLLTKEDFVILPFKWNSHTDIGSTNQEDEVSSIACLSILFRYIWPSLKCRSLIGLVEDFLFYKLGLKRADYLSIMYLIQSGS